MFSHHRYEQQNLCHSDIADGIIMFVMIILSIFMICMNISNGHIITIIVYELLVNTLKILFIIFFNGTNNSYINNWKKKIYYFQLIIGLCVFINSFYVSFELFGNENMMSVVLSYVIVSFARIANIMKYLVDEKW